MPSRNILKQDVPGGFYHIYSRGVDKRQIFLEPKDYVVFLNLLKRYLSVEPQKDMNGILYPHLYGKLELLAFCLMPNHLHLLIYQEEAGAMQQLMRAVLTSYSRHFNKTYNRRGPLFESRYKASLISDQAYVEHISRYIHLNPKDWRIHPYSSLPYFMDEYSAEWVRPGKITQIFESASSYLNFLEDYEDYKKQFDEIKHELAST